MSRLVIAAVDVGSPRNIGWWRQIGGDDGRGGKSLDDLAALLSEDLRAGRSVALGFESPMFIPRPASAERLNRARRGEGRFPWSAGAGTAVLASGIQQSVYLLSALASETAQPVGVGFDVEALAESAANLVIWEAFVSGRAKSPLAENLHIEDARVAVVEFRKRHGSGTVPSDIADTRVTSIAGLAVLVSGLSSDLGLLTQPCVVVRAGDFIG